MARTGLVVIGTIFAYAAFFEHFFGQVLRDFTAYFDLLTVSLPLSLWRSIFIVDVIGIAMIVAVLLISLQDLLIQKEKGIL